MGSILEERYFWMVIIGIGTLIGGLIFMFFVYPALFSGNTILYIVDIVGIISGAALVIIGIIMWIAD